MGRNGGGDPYFTDGEIDMARLVAGCETKAGAPEALPSPQAVKIEEPHLRAARADMAGDAVTRRLSGGTPRKQAASNDLAPARICRSAIAIVTSRRSLVCSARTKSWVASSTIP